MEKGGEGELKTFKLSNQEPLSNKDIKDVLGISNEELEIVYDDSNKSQGSECMKTYMVVATDKTYSVVAESYSVEGDYAIFYSSLKDVGSIIVATVNLKHIVGIFAT